MRIWLSLLMLWLLVNAGTAQAQTTARPGDLLAWDQIQTDTVTRFEIRVDTGAFTSIGLPPVSNDGTTPAGFNSYTWQIPITTTPGAHTYAVRACNAAAAPTECGPELSGVVTIAGRTPTQPRGPFRVRPMPVATLTTLPPGGAR